MSAKLTRFYLPPPRACAGRVAAEGGQVGFLRATVFSHLITPNTKKSLQRPVARRHPTCRAGAHHPPRASARWRESDEGEFALASDQIDV